MFMYFSATYQELPEDMQSSVKSLCILGFRQQFWILLVTQKAIFLKNSDEYFSDLELSPVFCVECANVSVPLLMYEDTQACLCQTYEEPLKVLERKVAEADAFLLVTDRPGFQIPSSLATVKHRFTGNNFTWRPYGVQCVLLGGSVHSRKVAMRLRVLLEGSDYPYMSGVLPRRCSWTQMYAVDPSLETPGPCVL